jgi:hypothetical protein
MSFLYETHIHTKESSACSLSGGREYIKKYLDLGYTGIIITDHFYRGNCRPNRNLRWDKWVHEFCRGYEIALEEGKKQGLDVFFGWEETIDGDDYLVYGLDKEWLLKHPEVVNWTRQEQFKEVKRYGGCVVHAHPFRYSNNFKRVYSAKRHVDALEAANNGNNQICDAFAWAHAKKQKFPAMAGSDIHYAGDIWQEAVFGVYLSKRMETIADYVDAVINNNIAGLKVPVGRFDYEYQD